MKKIVYGLAFIAGVAAAFIAGANIQKANDIEFRNGQFVYNDMN